MPRTLHSAWFRFAGFAARFVATAAVTGAGHAASASRSLDSAQAIAQDARQLIFAVAAPVSGSAALPSDAPAHLSLGATLADYASRPAGDPAGNESFVEASRRILAGGRPSHLITPATASHQLAQAAASLHASLRGLETESLAADSPVSAAALRELRQAELLARFHARRIVAAMHYNLFKRGLKLAELLAATLIEKEVVALWRELTALAAKSPQAAAWQAELKKLQADLRELEEQCCPPDEAIMKEKVWRPDTDLNRAAH